MTADWIRWRVKVEPWPEAVNGKELLDEIAKAIERLVVLPKWALEALSLWVVHTYAFRLRNVTTYLGIESPQHRCGKSTLLDVLGRLANRPVRSANISPPALFRVIAETSPTLLIDEADTFLRSEELMGIFNSGYSLDGAYVTRVTSELTNYDEKAGKAKGAAASPGEGQGNGRLLQAGW
jgi:putative DNA primase/helicase